MNYATNLLIAYYMFLEFFKETFTLRGMDFSDEKLDKTEEV